MKQDLRLFDQSVNNRRMGVPQIAYGNSGHKVGVLPSLIIPETIAAPFDQNQGKPLVGARNDRIRLLNDFVFHCFTSVPMPLSVNNSSKSACLIFPLMM
jgi:hypothetical protein